MAMANRTSFGCRVPTAEITDDPLTLEETIRGAYHLFSGPAPTGLGACTVCCLPPEIERRMLSGSRSAISRDDLVTWSTSAFGGDQAVVAAALRWLLPRMMELIAQGEDIDYKNNLALNRLKLGGFPEDWSAEEVALIQRFGEVTCAEAVKQRWAAGQGMRPALDDYLCMCARAPLDIPWVLQAVSECADADLVMALHPEPRTPSILFTTFWERDEGFTPEPAIEQILAWYRSPIMLARMTDVAADTGQPAEIRRRAEVLFDDMCAR